MRLLLVDCLAISDYGSGWAHPMMAVFGNTNKCVRYIPREQNIIRKHG